MRDYKVVQTLGIAVRTQRKRLGLTQQDLAEYAGVGVVFVIAIEKGKSSLRLDKLLDVLSILGLQLRIEVGKLGLSVEPKLGADK